MTVINIEVDGRAMSAEAGSTVIDACRAAGVDVPSLCHLKDSAPFTSCMMCIVQDADTGRTYPSCSAIVQDGMRLRTHSDEIESERRGAMELLLSEHVGNCEGPCRNGCPAHLDIPQLMTLTEHGSFETASVLMENRLVLPSSIERICPGMCEHTCRRRFHDAPVGIRKVAIHAADYRIEHDLPLPVVGADTGKRVAVIGAGPAGLSAAWHLRRAGHAVSLLDSHEQLGGMLRYAVPTSKLPRHILDADCARIERMDIDFRMGVSVGEDVTLAALLSDFDVIVIAIGKTGPEVPATYGVESAFNGFRIQAGTFQTSDPRMFAIGDAVRARRLAANSVADGEAVAHAIDGFFKSQSSSLPRRFDSKVAFPDANDMATMMHGASPAGATQPTDESGRLSIDEARQESTRCMHCECLAADTCTLRVYADELKASQDVYRHRERAGIEKIRQHASVIFEPGKCIKCGICVRISERAREPLGLTFVERGFDVRIGTPLNRTLREGLTRAAKDCVDACPTAALAFERERATINDERRMTP